MTRTISTITGIIVAAVCFLSAILWLPSIAGGQAVERQVAQEKAAPAAADKQPVSYWMTKKLEYSQNILGGLATADYDKIITNAQSLRNLSKVGGFVRGQSPGYRTQLHIFEESADEIIRQARRDNVDGAALAFTQMTVSCVNCHKHLRESK